MKESGSLIQWSERAEVSKFGKMAPLMKDGSRETSLKEKEDSFTLMVTFMKAILLMIRLKVTEFILITMEPRTKAIG
jgi:hypothetical protein